MIKQYSMEWMRRALSLALAVLFLVVGGITCVWLVRTKPAPERRSQAGRPLDVAVVEVVPSVEATPIIGHGSIRAKHQVKIVPQVSGQLIHVHEDLVPGKVIPEGDLLFEIDSTVYEAQLRQAEAEIRQLEAALERSDQELANLDERIANAQQMLAIDENDYGTSRQLYEEEQVGAKRDLDFLYQKVLSRKDALIELRSRRSVIPHVKAETLAQLDAARARHTRARHDLRNTKIACPFEARVELVAAYESQVVTAHFSIATLTDMSAFELPVGIDPRELQWLDRAIRPEALEQGDAISGPEVAVHWSLHGQEFGWRGYVTRLERVDEATRTARLVVEIRDVDMKATVRSDGGSSAPALAIGMHCRAELPAEPLDGALLVPRHAIHDNRWVYVFEPAPEAGVDDSVGRLGRREVPMLRAVGDAVLVEYAGREGSESCELTGGERVVVSPLVKPVIGMPVRLRDERIASAVEELAIPTASEGRLAVESARWWPRVLALQPRVIPQRFPARKGD
jgi:multidrug efflux pump subunit AcrA (membrane-fusion protein)